MGCWGWARVRVEGGSGIEAKGGPERREFVGKTVKRFLFSKVESRARTET